MASIVENRIFIRNVPQAVTRDDLATHFGQFGSIVDLYLPLVYGSAQHKSMAFVSYENPESVKVALAHPTHELNGETLSVDVCLSKGKGGKDGGKGAALGGALQVGGSLLAAAPQVAFAAAAAARPAPGPQIKPGRLFLTRVSQNISSEDLMAYFQQFGELEDVYVPPGGKSIAFVSFRDPAVAQAVLQAPTHEVKQGCAVNVDAAIDRPQAGMKGAPVVAAGFAGGFGGYQPQPQTWIAGKGGGYGAPLTTGALPAVVPAVQTQQPAQGPHIKPGRLFLTKVPHDVTQEDLMLYFQQYGNLEDVYIPPGGKSIAFVSFQDPSTASAVLQAPVHEIKQGSFVTVDAAIDRPPMSGKGGLTAAGKGYAPRFSPY